VGSEETFSYDLSSEDEVLREALRLADRTAGRLRSRGLCGRTVTLKVRYSNFKTITRSQTLPEATDVAAEIYEVVRRPAEALFAGGATPRIRLLGVSVSGLVTGPPRRQMALVGGGGRWDDATKAIDSIRRRFGDRAVGPATLLDGGGIGDSRPYNRD
jgi:DNA polymerase-4